MVRLFIYTADSLTHRQKYVIIITDMAVRPEYDIKGETQDAL